MDADERHSPHEGVTPLKTEGELDEVRLEAALGHKQELKRNFGLWSLTSLGIVIAKYVFIPMHVTCVMSPNELTEIYQLVGINRWNNRRRASKRWPHGCHLWPDSRQHLLYRNLRLAR